MEDGKKKLIVKSGQWCEHTERLIAQALQHAKPEQIRAQLDHGAQLFQVTHGNELIGAFVLRVDGDEGVIVTCTVKLEGVDMFTALLPSIEAMFNECKSIRFHTARPALARKMATLGYAPAEMVCIKTL
jgi:hypothetical protein